MNEYLSKLIDLGEMVGGKISFEEGFATFERLPKEEIEALPEEQRAYATTAMGRAVFQLGQDGKIINYKGVDSHLDNSEAGLVNKVGAIVINYTKDGEDYISANYPVNLALFLGQRPDIRIRGASPLEDLEIEADINSRMQGNGIKLPVIRQVREFSEDILEKFGLPRYVAGNFDEFTSDYEVEDIARKSYLKAIMGSKYEEQKIEGKRPEKCTEYLKRLGIEKDPRIHQFLKLQKVSIAEFSNYVDKVYSRGQRYGQAIREIESPFRIADLEILLDDPKNLPTIEAIVGFTESMHPDRVPFENYFAKQLGANLGNMMNIGWECENFSHRQDYCLTGEMCDDSYKYAPKELDKLDELEKTAIEALKVASTKKEKEKAEEMVGQAKAGKTEKRLKYFTQIYLLASNIKVLQDEMAMRGKSKEEIDSVLTDFLDTFSQTVNLERASLNISDKTDTAQKALEILGRTPKNIANLLAFEPKGKDKSNINDEVVKTQTPFNGFFDYLSKGLSERFNFDRTFINETKDDVKGLNPFEKFGDNGIDR